MTRSMARLAVGLATACSVLGGAGCSGLGQPKPAWELPPPPPAEAPVVQDGALHRADLENGLELLLLEDRRLPLAAVGLTVPRGSAAEGLEEAGVAAFTAEVMRRGAGDRDALALARAVDEAGATLSVASGWDTTSIVVSGLSRDLDLLMEILADVALRPRMETGEAERARAEQLAGIEQAVDDPGTLVRWHAMETLYPDHRYGLPVEGTAETVASLTPESAREFHQRLFVPGEAIFFAAGDIDADDIERRVRERLGPQVWPSAVPMPASQPPPTEAPGERRIVVVDRPDLGQARIVVGHEGIARDDDRRVSADLMNKVLGGSGFASRLMQRVRADEGLTYGVGSRFELRRHPGPFTVGTFTRAPETRRVVDLLLEEMERIRSEPPSDEELAKAASLAVGNFGLSLETSEAVLAALVNLDVYDLPRNSLDTYRGRVRDVTTEDAAKDARELVHPERAAIVVLGPADVLVPLLDDLGDVQVIQP